MGIEADGGVKGCLSLQAVETTEGNLHNEPLADIWFREGAFAYNRDFSLSDLAGFCRSCRYATLCRGGCFSARTCEGGVENTYCYHRVSVLAQRRSIAQTLTKALAPAALAALFSVSINCGVDYYGLPDGDGDVDGDADGDGDVDGDAYGLPDFDADVDGGADYYGLPDADADVDSGADYYGLPDGDADADIDGGADYYGLPDDGGPDIDGGADYYGLPDDGGPDIDGGADWYGLPDGGD
jgi:radical SAM protein with 4Fe4S-binding SPASM domain